MPGEADRLDEADQEHDVRAIAAAPAEIAHGKGVPHRRVRNWRLPPARGNRVAPPSS